MSNHGSENDEDGYELVGEHVRIFRRGRIWYANFQHNKRQHRPSLKTTSKKEARRRALQLNAELDTGRWQPEVKASTVEEAIDAYLNYLRAEGRAKKTLVKYTHIYKRVQELADARRVDSLTGIDLKFLDAYRRMRVEEKAKDKTRYTETIVIRQLVNFALSRGMLSKDTMPGLKLKKPKPTPQPCWTYTELQQILTAAPAELIPALTLLGETGMRFGELQWLTWDDVDLEKNHLRVRPKEGWKPKSGDERVIPISNTAKKILESLPRRWRWVVTMPPSPSVRQSGRQWTERRLLDGLKRVLKGLGMPGKLHTFRHTFISHALLSGMPVAVVQDWVGHVDAEIIKLYTHIHNDASQLAMQRLAKLNDSLQEKENENHGTENRPAQIQHTHEEE